MSIYICGDSTAASYDPANSLMMGWGQALQEYLPGIPVYNHAMAGRSTRTFLAEGRLDRVLEKIAPGDLMLIQFAHNDENAEKPERYVDPEQAYPENLRIFIREARGKRAIPVLMTPICMRLWEHGGLQPSHGKYVEAVRETARMEKVPLIDLYSESFRLAAAAGEEGSKAMFLHLEPGEDSRYPEGARDNAHTRAAAARPFAAFVADSLRRMGLADGSACGGG